MYKKQFKTDFACEVLPRVNLTGLSELRYISALPLIFPL